MAGTPVAVLRKATTVLEHLAFEGECSVTRLAELTGEPKSTIHRLLSSLNSLGLVDSGSRRGSFRLGLKILELGSRVLARFDERQIALPWLQRLHEQTEQTVFLLARDRFSAVCIDRIEGRWVRSMVLQLGGSLPLHIGAAPRVLLAYAGRDFWQAYVAHSDLKSFLSDDRADPAEFVSRLEEICKCGYETSEDETTIGMGAIGAPIFDSSGVIRAAVSISGPTAAVRGDAEAENIAHVVATAAAITQTFAPRLTLLRGEAVAASPADAPATRERAASES